MVGAVAIVLIVVLSLLWLPRSGAQVQASWYPRIVPGEVIERALAADETVTFVYDGRPNMHRLDAGERYMLVELTYEVDGDQYPDPLLMVAYEAVPFIFYSENQFTTNATYYDQVAFQLVKTYHYVVVDRQGIRPGSWYITITNLPVWSQNVLNFRLAVTTSGTHPCPNRCSNHGTCTDDGSCACAPGWGDNDCSHTIRPLALETTLSTHLRVDEWQYFYVEPLAVGETADDSSYIFADMEITSNPRCDALLYFKHADAGFTALPTHYDFQHHSDSRSFYSYETSYQVTNQPILPGQYIIGIYNYKGRRIEADCDISLTVTACYTGDGACEGSRNAHRGFQTGAGWFLGLFMLAGLPLFCFIPVFYCIRRIRVAHHQRHGHAEQMSWVAGVGPQGHTRPRPLAGLTDAEIASVSSFVLGTGNGRNRDQSTQHPSLWSDTCSVCLMEFETGESLRELACRHVFHLSCIDEWLRRQRSCPLCKGDALQGAACYLSSSTEAHGSGHITDNNGSVGDMPGTPTHSPRREEPATLEAADIEDVEDPPSSQMQALNPAGSPRETVRPRARTPPLPSLRGGDDDSPGRVVGP